MTNYPINYTTDTADGSAFHDGFAADEAAAIEMVKRAGESLDAAEWRDHSAEFTSREAGPKQPTREAIEQLYADEIEAGYCTVGQVYGGWIAYIETIAVEAEERETNQ